jgi:hypothetical protein
MAVEAWRIYYVDPCQYTIPDPKPKFVIIVITNPQPWGFLINSEIYRWIAINPENRACQAPILASEHPCLHYDSWVDCLDLKSFDEDELSNRLDLVSATAKASILEAVRNSKQLVNRFRKKILKG